MVTKNRLWRGVFIELKDAAILLKKNFKNIKLPTLFYLHFMDNGYINLCVA